MVQAVREATSVFNVLSRERLGGGGNTTSGGPYCLASRQAIADLPPLPPLPVTVSYFLDVP